MAIGAQFAAALQALLQKLQQSQADVDYKEQARRRIFAQQESGQLEAYPLALRSANQNAADRGMVQSGINLGTQGKINRAHLETLAGITSSRDTDLRDLARQRLANQTDYDINYADLLRQDTAANAVNPAVPNPPVVPPPQVNAPPAVMSTKGKPKIPVRRAISTPSTPVPPIRTIAKRKPSNPRGVQYS